MFDFLRKPIFLLIVGAALIIAAVWAWSSNRSSTDTETNKQAINQTSQSSTNTISNLTNIDVATIDEPFAAQLAIADQKAGEVDKKLQLSAVQVVLSGDLKPSTGTTYYVYTTPNDKVNNWVIAISNADSKFVRSRTPKVDYIGDLSAINRSFLKVNYVAALQVAEKAGGLSFRQAYLPASVRITLKNSDPNAWLYWFVEYSSSEKTEDYKIDANTGANTSESADSVSDEAQGNQKNNIR